MPVTFWSFPALTSTSLPSFLTFNEEGLLVEDAFGGDKKHSQGPLGQDYFSPVFFPPPGDILVFPESETGPGYYFVSIQELDTGRSGTPFSAGGPRTYVRRFRVIARNNVAGAATVCSCPGVPAPYAPYIPYRKEEWDRLAVAVNISAAQEHNEDDSQCWIITVQYSTDVPDSGPEQFREGLGNALGGPQNNPWEQRAKQEWDIETETLTPQYDLDGKVYANSTEMAFTPPYQYTDGYRVLTVTRNERVTDFENRPKKYKYVVNSVDFKGYPPGYALCTGGRATEVWRGNLRFYRVVYRILFKERVPIIRTDELGNEQQILDDEGNPLYTPGWQPRILDAGMYQRAGFFEAVVGQNELVPIIRMGVHVNQPVLLNGLGREQTERDPVTNKLIPVYLNFRQYPAEDLNELITP